MIKGENTESVRKNSKMYSPDLSTKVLIDSLAQ